MRNHIGLVALALLACALSTPASAHWQWTQWGMSRAALDAAAEAHSTALNETLSIPEQVELRGAYRVMDQDMSLRFIVHPVDGLWSVILQQANVGGRCSSVESALLTNYGQPLDRKPFGEGGTQIAWLDKEGGNRISYRFTGPFPGSTQFSWCDIEYNRLDKVDGL